MKVEMDKVIQIPGVLFAETWTRLNRIGRGKVEAVAVWGGTRGLQCDRVEKAYYVDQADVFRGQRLHQIPAEQINSLFAFMRSDGLAIIADVHTHPTDWVGLSAIDQANPTEFRRGFVSIVIPWYGSTTLRIREIGVHIYHGDGKWTEADPEQVLEIT
jgi:hypothetical protein